MRGVASGVLFMAFFGTLWASIGIGGLQGWGGLWLAIVAVLVGIALLSGGISLLLASRRLPNQVAEAAYPAMEENGDMVWHYLRHRGIIHSSCECYL